MEQIFQIKGMHCGSCAVHVKQALLELSGVTGAEVDANAGTAKVVAGTALERTKVEDALHKAGDYELLEGNGLKQVSPSRGSGCCGGR